MTDALPPYTLIRSDRKTLAFVIDGAGALLVRAPRRMPLCDIEAVLRRQTDWVRRKQAARISAPPPPPPLTPKTGETLPYRGGALTLRLANTTAVRASDGILFVPERGADNALIRAWLDRQARAILFPRAEALSQAAGLTLSAIRLSHAKTRWGSMSAKRSLNLNAMLMLCPAEVADYVIWHELSHIRHMDHSPAFWAQVARFCPEYPKRRAWLRQHASLIRLLG